MEANKVNVANDGDSSAACVSAADSDQRKELLIPKAYGEAI